MAKTFSGRQVINILSRKFGFYFVSQKGSHVKLRKKVGKKVFATVVPLHKELALGTLKGTLELAGITDEEFRKAVQ